LYFSILETAVSKDDCSFQDAKIQDLTPIRLALVACLSIAAAGQAARTPSSVLLVLNKTEATLVIIDPGSGNIMARIPTGEGPHEVAVSADGALAFVSNYGGTAPGNSLSVIDLAAQKEVRRVDVLPLTRPHGLAVLDGKLYFTSETARVVARYDPAGNMVDARIPTDQNTTHMVLASRDGRRLFTANIRSNTISMLDRADGQPGWTVTASVPVGRGPEGLDLSPDGRELWTAHSQDGGVSVIDVSTRTVVATLELKTQRSNRLKFTPDGGRVLISDLDAGQLLVIDARTRKEITRLAVGRQPEGILIVPDGSRAYVSEFADDRVAIVDLKTLTVTARLSPGRGPDGLAWISR
jgi:YVTN family beta-propeller protein